MTEEWADARFQTAEDFAIDLIRLLRTSWLESEEDF
jgi:hypothetical protein